MVHRSIANSFYANNNKIDALKYIETVILIAKKEEKNLRLIMGL